MKVWNCSILIYWYKIDVSLNIRKQLNWVLIHIDYTQNNHNMFLINYIEMIEVKYSNHFKGIWIKIRGT